MTRIEFYGPRASGKSRAASLLASMLLEEFGRRSALREASDCYAVGDREAFTTSASSEEVQRTLGALGYSSGRTHGVVRVILSAREAGGDA